MFPHERKQHQVTALFPLPEIPCTEMFSQQGMEHIHLRFQNMIVENSTSILSSRHLHVCWKGRTTAPNGCAAQEGSSSNKNFGVSGMQFCLDHKMLQGFFNSSSIKLRLYGSDDKLPILRRAKTCSGFVLSTNKR